MTSTEFEQDCREARGFNEFEDEPCKCAGCHEYLGDKPYHGEWHWDCAVEAYTHLLGIRFVETDLIDEFMAWLPSDYWARIWHDFVDSVHFEAQFLLPPKAMTYLKDFCLEDMHAWIDFLEK